MNESTTTIFQEEESCGTWNSSPVESCPPTLSFETLMTILSALVIFALALGCVVIYCIQAKITRNRILGSTRSQQGLSNSSIWITNSDNSVSGPTPTSRTRPTHGEFNPYSRNLDLPYYRFENPPPSYFSIQNELGKNNLDSAATIPEISEPPPAYESDFHDNGNLTSESETNSSRNRNNNEDATTINAVIIPDTQCSSNSQVII